MLAQHVSYNMEEMKNRFCLLLPLLFALMLASCATTSAGTSDINIEKKQSNKKLLFKDWKYKGFGQPLPAWFDAAYKNNVSGLQKTDVKLSGSEIVIIRGEGVNADQADKILKIKQEEISSDFILYDTCWASIGAGDYIALAVFYK